MFLYLNRIEHFNLSGGCYNFLQFTVHQFQPVLQVQYWFKYQHFNIRGFPFKTKVFQILGQHRQPEKSIGISVLTDGITCTIVYTYTHNYIYTVYIYIYIVISKNIVHVTVCDCACQFGAPMGRSGGRHRRLRRVLQTARASADRCGPADRGDRG